MYGGDKVEEMTFSLSDSNYSGPLELLLSLISKKKINITDISLLEIIDQYLEQISAWKENSIEPASEFLEMAARLVNIKTNELLPKHETENTEKQELLGRLIEYSICKNAAQLLRLCESGFGSFVREPTKYQVATDYTLTHSSLMLYNAYLDAMGRGKRKLPPPAEIFSPLVVKPVASVDEKIFDILNKLKTTESLSYNKMFLGYKTKDELVAAFLAVLELLKENKINFDGKFLSLSKNRVD